MLVAARRRLRHDEDMTSSVRRQLAEKVDLRELAHLEQLAVFSDPDRVPARAPSRRRSSAWCPPPPPRTAADTRWHPVTRCRRWRSTTARWSSTPAPAWSRRCPTRISDSPWRQGIRPVDAARHLRRRARLSGRRHQPAARARRRGVITRPEPPRVGPQRRPPAALYRFTESRYRVTDEFAALRRPGESAGS
jgi:ADP-ribose pyrophosphatase YjhB (NUDIX family)